MTQDAIDRATELQQQKADIMTAKSNAKSIIKGSELPAPLQATITTAIDTYYASAVSAIETEFAALSGDYTHP